MKSSRSSGEQRSCRHTRRMVSSMRRRFSTNSRSALTVGWMCSSLIAQSFRSDGDEVRAQAAAPRVLAQDRVVVLDQLEARLRDEVLALLRRAAELPAHQADGVVDEAQVLDE